MRSIRLPQRLDKRVAAFLSDPSIVVSAPVVDPGITVVSLFCHDSSLPRAPNRSPEGTSTLHHRPIQRQVGGTLEKVCAANMFGTLTPSTCLWQNRVVPTESQQFYKAFGAKIATARKARKMSQAKLGTALGLSRTSITNIEKGRQQVQVHTLARLADILNFPVSDLLPGKHIPDQQTVTDNLRIYSPEAREWATRIISTYEGANDHGLDTYVGSEESKGAIAERKRGNHPSSIGGPSKPRWR